MKKRKTAPCTLNCCNFLSRGCTAVLEQALVDIVSHMIRLKLFENVCKWGRRRWDIESSFHVEKNGGSAQPRRAGHL